MTSVPAPVERKPRYGDELEVELERFDERGRAVGVCGAFRVTVARGLPGERVLAQVLRRRRDAVEARVLAVLTTSPARVAPRCAHFQACGGCSFQDLDYAAQLVEKRASALRTLADAGLLAGPDAPRVDAIVGAGDPWGYRNKMDFSFSTRRWIEPGEPAGASHGFALGLHPREFYGKVIDVGACSIQFLAANAILASVRRIALAHGLEAWDAKLHTGLLRHLVLRASRATGAILVNLVTAAEAPERIGPLVRELLAAHPEITTLVQNLHASPALAALSEREIVLHGAGSIVERVADLDFRLSAHSFFQTNTAQAEALFRIVGEEAAPAPGDVVYDLYCGAGAFTLLLARRARSAWGFELVEPAVRDAVENARANGIANAHFRCVDLGRPLPEDAERPAADVVVVDPPRAGLHPRTIEALAALAGRGARRAVYVSCNLAAAARDVRALEPGGWRLVRVRPIDLFPHTPHLECVLTLERAP